ncbi:MAG: DUF1295 domain-containing protein [Pseudomonadales bacterium]|nr:DUF1295 domain-containing protein [Pseudomonadales bacterium]
MDEAPRNKSRDLLTIVAGYVVALVAAGASLALVDAEPLIDVLVADVVATMVIFVCSLLWKNSSWYDAYWSVAPPAIAGWFLYLGMASGADASALRQALVTIVVWFWAVRLTANWAWGWTGMDHEDWRYENLQQQAGVLWWPLSFAGIHLFPTLCVFAGCIALYPALALPAREANALDALAFLLGVGATWLQFRSDADLHRFRAERASRAEVLTTGIWAWCRHPNYLGEILFWVSLFLFGVAAAGGVYPWSWLGPAVMIALFLIVSIPMIEKKLLADKPGYADYRARTPMILPWPPKGARG